MRRRGKSCLRDSDLHSDAISIEDKIKDSAYLHMEVCALLLERKYFCGIVMVSENK